MLLDYLEAGSFGGIRKFEIDYGNRIVKSISDFKKWVQINGGMHIHQFIGCDQSGSPRFIGEADLGTGIGWSYILTEFCLVFEGHDLKLEALLLLIKDFRKVFPLEYGYSLDLPKQTELLTEKKIKRSLFGYTSPSNVMLINWQSCAIGIRHGYLRDVYPINLLNESQFANQTIKELLEKGIGRIIEIDQGINAWILNESEEEKARVELAKKGFLIAEESSYKKFIASPNGISLHKEMTSSR
jgi:hypothetical protein